MLFLVGTNKTCGGGFPCLERVGSDVGKGRGNIVCGRPYCDVPASSVFIRDRIEVPFPQERILTFGKVGGNVETPRAQRLVRIVAEIGTVLEPIPSPHYTVGSEIVYKILIELGQSRIGGRVDTATVDLCAVVGNVWVVAFC